MEPEATATKDSNPETENISSHQPSLDIAPADALSRTPDELEDEKQSRQAPETEEIASKEQAQKKPSKIKQFFRRINLYFLIFIILIAIGAAVTIVNYINSQKDPIEPTIANQELTEKALQELANRDASVGKATQTLTIQGNTIIDGQSLMRGNLNVAGNLQTGGSIQGPELTISGRANLGDAQINTLQVASNTAIQGNTTVRDLAVSGTSSFSGAVTASQLTVTQLIMSGNATLQVPNHIGFTGPSPSRTINSGVLGGGGSASVSGSDTAGVVNISTGNGPSAGCFVRINFNQRFSNQPRVIISPIGVAAGQTQHYVDRDQAGFSICTASPAPANQSFAFDYFVMN